MAAHVDIHNCVIREGDAVWPFDVDCREDVAEVVIDDRRYKLHPLGWREKRNLARYVQLGERFLQTQFLRVSLHSSATDLPASAQHREVLSALARWLNAPDGSFGLPLDRKFLTSVTLDLCRSMQLTPAAFDALAAAEVELLWQADRARNAPPVTAPTTSDIANNAPGLTRIVVLP